jgi:DNA mismatch repair ATPase MutS
MNSVQHYSFLVVSFFVCVCAAASPVSAPVAIANPVVTSFDKIAHMHLQIYAQQSMDEEKKERERAKALDEKAGNLLNFSATDIPELGDIEKLRLVYEIFSLHEKTGKKHDSSVQFCLNDNVFQDLEIYAGMPKTIERHVAGIATQYTQTIAGRVSLQRMLFEPSCNIGELRLRQDILRTLLDDPALLKKISRELKNLHHHEESLLWFWKEVMGSLRQVLDQVAFPMSFNQEWMKRSPFWNELTGKGTILLGVGMETLMLCFFLYGTYNPESFMGNARYAPPEQLSMMKMGMRVYYGLMFIASLYTAYTMYKMLALHTAVTHAVHEKVNHVAGLFNGMQDMGNIIKNHESFKELFPEHKKLINVFESRSSELRQLEALFKTSTLNSEPSFFSYKGRALAAFSLLREVKDSFFSSVETLGKLDAYVAVAKLIKEKQEHATHAKVCFVDYKQQDYPEIMIKDFWHPFLDQNTVVTNSIALSGKANAQQTPKDMIVTGPNAGGKSTAINILLAQTFGFAFAESMSLTPFAKINTYMNISDSAGFESHFQAEMYRAQDLIKTIKSLEKNQFSFIVMDELFTGTNPEEGEAAAVGVANRLSSYGSSLCVLATHFKVMTTLEKETHGIMKNYKVTASKRADGSFFYPYTLQEGFSDQKIALDLLAHEGFDHEILDVAYDVLNSKERRNEQKQ